MTTYLNSILNQRCPACRKGRLFKTGPYRLKTFDHMHSHCEHCHQPFEPEPGFYTGAMYVSYAFQVAIVVVALVVAWILPAQIEPVWYVAGVAGFVVLFLPLLYRLSRSVWAHLFIRYRPFEAPSASLRRPMDPST